MKLFLFMWSKSRIKHHEVTSENKINLGCSSMILGGHLSHIGFSDIPELQS